GLAGLGVFPALPQHAHNRLADGEIAGGSNRHDALAGLGKDVELAEGRDVVDARIGARIGEHDEAVANENAAAIGHWSVSASSNASPLSSPRRRGPIRRSKAIVGWPAMTETLVVMGPRLRGDDSGWVRAKEKHAAFPHSQGRTVKMQHSIEP